MPAESPRERFVRMLTEWNASAWGHERPPDGQARTAAGLQARPAVSSSSWDRWRKETPLITRAHLIKVLDATIAMAIAKGNWTEEQGKQQRKTWLANWERANAAIPGVVEIDDARRPGGEAEGAVEPGSDAASSRPPAPRGLILRPGQHDGPGTVNQHLLVAIDTAGGQLVDPDGAVTGNALLSSDGRILASQAGELLAISWLNRVTGQVHSREQSFSLSSLGDGTVLAVAPAGRSGINFVFAGEGTRVCHYNGAEVTVLDVLSPGTASAAVLIGRRVLLATPDSRGAVRCQGFVGLSIISMVGATAAGRTLVLARGTGGGGGPEAQLETDGSRVQRFLGDAHLVLPLSGREPPEIFGAVSGAGPLSRRSGKPFSAWKEVRVGQRQIA